MKQIKAILIDDERLARAEIRRLLRKYPDIVIVAEAENTDEAAGLIREHRPDLLLLDIQMPGKSGFELLEMLDRAPEVVFITAYDQHAVKAFEAEALDYLVKPVRDERFTRMMERVRNKLSGVPAAYPQQLFLKNGNRCKFVRLDSIFLIESVENYARLYFGDQTMYIKRSLNKLEESLDNRLFFRINRTQIVNLHFIGQVHPLPKGKLHLGLTTGQLLEVSERQSVKFKTFYKLGS